MAPLKISIYLLCISARPSHPPCPAWLETIQMGGNPIVEDMKTLIRFSAGSRG